MIRVIILGHGMVANHLAVGIERIKQGELEPYGVPLAEYKLPYSIEDIDIVASYDVDQSIVGKSIYYAAKKALDSNIDIPRTLRDVYIREGIHLGSLEGMPIEAVGIEDKLGLNDALNALVDEWREYKPDIILNIITTEDGSPFNTLAKIKYTLENGTSNGISASQAYALAAALYARQVNPVAFINGIPMAIANDDAIVRFYEESGAVVFGDDGATGATPITADILEHMHNRNRHVKFIVQFNIGGNNDFLALTIPEKNKMKEKTKSSIVQDILGYDAPHYIKPTGYLEPLGDKKFISMLLEYKTFNGLTDELYIAGRINDSPAMAGGLVDLIRLGKIAIDNDIWGTVYEVNAFFMKKPGPSSAKSVSKIVAYYNLLKWLRALNAITISEDIGVPIEKMDW
jgi:myo-inositol-1-phosphate synthase